MQIRLGENELPLSEDLEKLTISQWMDWLHARLSTYDAYTGQVLIGEGFPLALVRDSVIRLDAGDASQRCVEACLQHVRDRVLRLRRQNYRDDEERRGEIYELYEMLRFLKELPPFIVKQCATLVDRTYDLYECVIRPPGLTIVDLPGDAALVRNTIVFLRKYAPGHLRAKELEPFLQFTPCSRTTLHVLQKLEPERFAHWLREYFRFCRSNEQLPMFAYEASRVRRKLGEKRATEVIGEVEAELSDAERPDFVNALKQED